MKRVRKPKAQADKRPGNLQLGEYVQPAVNAYYDALDAADLAWAMLALLDEAYVHQARTEHLRANPEQAPVQRPPGRDVDIRNVSAFFEHSLTMALREQKRNPGSTAMTDFFSLDAKTFNVPEALGAPPSELPTAAEFLDKLYAQTWSTKRADQLARLGPKLVEQLPELNGVLSSRFNRLELAMDMLRASVAADSGPPAERKAASLALDRAFDAYESYTRGVDSLARSPQAEDRVLQSIDSAIKWHLYTVPFEQLTLVSATDLAHARAIKLITVLQAGMLELPDGKQVELRTDYPWVHKLVTSVSDAIVEVVPEQIEELAPGALTQYKPERSAWTSVDALLRSGEYVEGLGAGDAPQPDADAFGGNYEKTMRFTPDMLAAFSKAAEVANNDDDSSDGSESTDAGYRRPDLYAGNAGDDEQPSPQQQQQDEDSDGINLEQSIDSSMDQLRIDSALRNTGYGAFGHGRVSRQASTKGTTYKGGRWPTAQ